ncbi:hypothetical protein [Campylobacter sp. RM12637]|uniref:hypothetical protein n=2 Tax=unclassified Campylobacter TaxID=2593542 RepID=UPI0030149401|nr:hypothetical protein [Campylobacter sp. RM12637]
MRNKLSLSLLTCLAISGGGYLHAEELNTVCNDKNPCNIDGKTIEVKTPYNTTQDIIGNGATLDITGSLTSTGKVDLVNSTFKSSSANSKTDVDTIIGDKLKFNLSSANSNSFKVNNMILKNNSTIDVVDGTQAIKIGNLSLDNSIIRKNGIMDIDVFELSNKSSFTNTFRNAIVGELKIDETSTFHNWQGGSTIKKVTNNSTNGSNVTLKSEGSGITIGDSSSNLQGNISKVNIEGTTVIFSNLLLDNTSKIDVSGNIVLDNKININNMDLSKTTSTPTSHKIVIKDGANVIITDTNLTNQSINANSKSDKNGSLTIIGGIFKDVSIGGATGATNLANVTLDKVNIENSGLNKDNNIIAQNVTLNNITTSNNANINAKTKLDIKNSKIDNTNKLTATNAEIGTSTIGADINVTNELKATNGANLNGSITSGTIIAENGSIFNGNTKANDSITANSGSKFVGNVNATNKITSSGAIFNGEVTAKDLESSKNSIFNNTITASNSITSSDTTFAKNVSANTITANSGSVFNGTTTATDSITANSGSKFVGTTTATNKITSNGATFDGLVNTKDLESSKNSIFNNNITASNSITSSDTTFAKNVSANTITSTNSVFNGTTTATDSITANSGSKFVGNVNATNKITSNGATFEKEVKTAFLDAQKGSIFDTTSIVNATDINAVGSTFNGSIVKNNSITADSSIFANAIDTATLTAKNNSSFANVTANTITSTNSVFNGTTTATDSITANSGSKFVGNVNATNKITSNGATFDGVVEAKDLESSKNSIFNKNITASNSITSSDTTFKAIVNTATLNANSNSIFDTTSTINATDINAVGSTFNGSIVKNNSITADSSTFANAIDTATLTATNNSSFANVTANTITSTNSIFSGSVNASNSINSTSSTFKALVNTSSLTTDTNSVFSATSKVNVEKLMANNTNFQGLVDINCKNADCTSSLNNSKFNELSITNATISDTFTAHKLTANDKATFEKDIKSDFITANSGSVFNGTTTATDSIIANSGSTFNGFVSANNITSEKSVFNKEVNVKDTLKSNNSTFNSIVNANTIEAVLDTTFSKDSKVNASTINTSKSIFNGEVVVSNLNALNTKFNGATTIDCKDNTNCKSDIKASYFNDLTLKNNAKITLDEGSSANNLTLLDDTTYLALNGKSQITGDIKNEGIIEIVDGTISSKITGNGDLISNKVVYTNDVELSDIKGSGGKFGGITTTTNDVSVDNTTFEKDLNVGKTLYANQGNKFSGKVSATDAIFSLDTSKSMEKGNVITANQVDITKDLNIKDLNVTAENIKSNSARITNSTINSSNINSNLVNIANSTINSKLLGKDDSSSNVYDANIQKDSGTYTTKQSELNGGVRVDKLDTTNTHIKGQVAVNTLVANNSKFYIYGGGIDTSFHDIYSGAIIVREAISGANNTIQLANTNLTMLKDKEGFIPIAIVNNTTNSQRSDANSQSGISKDFFKVTYQTKVANYELADRFTHFNPNAKGNAIWSIGIKGDDLIDESNVDSVISGQDLGNIANGANSNNVNTSSLEVVLGDMFDLIDFDKDAVGTANFILTSPDYIANTKNNTLNNRLRLVKNQKVGNGFWLDNQMGYNKYEYSSIRYKNFNVGADKTNELSNSNLTLGVAASFGTAETKGNVDANSDSKGIGLYAMNVFNNGVFIGANAFYHNISSSYEADKLGIKADKNHNVYTASFESGVRFGDKYYFEPSLRYDLTSYKPTAISTNGLSISGDSQLKHTLSAKLEGGVSMLDSLDGFLSVALSKELTKKPDMLLIDEVKENIIEGKKGDTSVNLNFGVDYKINPNASFNINLGSNLYTNSDKELKGSLGFSYKF